MTKMNFTGDIMLARGVNNLIQSIGVNALFEPTKDILGDVADVTIVNLECPLTTATEHHPTKTIYFKAEPESASGLQFAGIDIVTIANNHIYDYLEQGILDTKETLEQYGIAYSEPTQILTEPINLYYILFPARQLHFWQVAIERDNTITISRISKRDSITPVLHI